jgi:phosphoesterase RecJ-like protein
MKVLADRIRTADRILMSTHQDPDGDGIGAILALAEALQADGKKVDVMLPDPCPERFRFLDKHRWLRCVATDAVDIGCPRPDLALIIDTHRWSLLGHIGELIRSMRVDTLFLDHHPIHHQQHTDVFDHPHASSAGEIVYTLLRDHLRLPIDKRIAECLYASIAFDTHSFRYIRNSPSPHRVAADLLARGVDANWVYRHLFASNPIGKMRLMGKLMAAVRIEQEGLLAWVSLPSNLIREHGVCVDDMRDVVNCLLELDGIEVAVMLKEVEAGTIKVSLRSKGKVQIHEVAQRLGGGGHPYAAGATLSDDLDRSKETVLGMIAPLLKNQNGL